MSDLHTLPVTSILTALLLVLLVFLSVMVTARRAALGGIQFGDNGDEVLRARIRAHGNFVEIAPIMIITVGLLEYAGAAELILWWLAGLFLLGRVLHIARMYIGNPFIGLLSIVSQHGICLYAAFWLLNRF